VDNARGASHAKARVVHNCEAPGGQPVFSASAVEG